LYTQYGGARPFGTALLIAGVNEEVYLFETDPSGAFTQSTATAIGIGKPDVEKFFQEKWRDNFSREDAIDLALRSLNLVSEEKLKVKNIEIITIELDDGYKSLSDEEILSSLNGLKKEFEIKKKRSS